MKRYIEGTRYVAGRAITQRYPARHVGTRPPGVLGAVDLTCLECGFVVCECPDGGWPPPIAPESAADALTHEPYGCVNRITDSPRECVESGHYWCDLSKKPAQPERRPGWRQEGEERIQRYRHAGLGAMAQLTLAGTWLAIGGDQVVVGHHTLEAAMQRAEELAALEGSR